MSPANPTAASSLIDYLETMESEGQIELWHTEGNEPFMTVEIGNHKENWRLQSETIRLRLSEISYNVNGRPLTDNALKDVLSHLKSKAIFTGPQYSHSYRVARHNGSIYIDIGDTDWQSIRVSQDGWEVIKNCPVRFSRTKHTRALPYPEKSSGYEILSKYLNVSEYKDLLLAFAFTVQCFLPEGPYPVFSLSGEQGSAKTSFARIIVSLTDPKAAPLRPLPNNERDLMIDATTNQVLAFDNISYIKASMSDALCRISSGGGFSTRALYTDNEPMIFEAQRPIILTGITEAARRSDLVDRTVSVELKPIRPEKRLSESHLEASLYRDRPQMLGAILDMVSGYLREIDNVQVENPPRMIDFAKTGEAIARTLGLAEGTFIEAYNSSQIGANENIVDGSPVGETVRILIRNEESWVGTAQQLLYTLIGNSLEGPDRSPGWPKNAARLSSILREIAPSFRSEGINVEFDTPKRRHITLSKITDISDTV